MKISIVIPSKNEADYVDRLIDFIKNNSNPDNIEEIIVVESFCTRQIVKVAEKRHAKLYYNLYGAIELQMDMGAFQAKGEVIYFIKPECIPPIGFDERILTYIQNKQAMGCFDLDKNESGNLAIRLFNTLHSMLFKYNFQVNSFFVMSKLYYQCGGLKKHNSYAKLRREITLSTNKSNL